MKAFPAMLIIFMGFLAFSVSGPISATEEKESKVVTAEGVAILRGKETAVARDQAIEDALRKAVEQAVGTWISSETMVQNYQLLSDRIYSRSQGYVQNYQVLSESKKGENLYSVKVQATIRAGELKDDLEAIGVLMERKRKPRLMVFIAEQNVGEPAPRFWWGGSREVTDLTVAETVINEKFLAKGFPMIDQKAAAKRIQASKAYRVSDLTNEDARTLGNQFDAEIVIVGKALAKYVGNIEGTSMKSFSGSVTARVIRTDDGSVIATSHASVPAPHIDTVAGGSKAIELASAKVADDLIDKIIKVWTREVSGTQLVQMIVKGLSSYGDMLKFTKLIRENVRGIKAVHQRKVSRGEGIIDVDIKGDAQSLADELSTKNFGNISVSVIEVTQNRIEVEVSILK